MILYPKAYFDKITDITIDFLKKNKINGLILDVDNTLIDFDRVMLLGLKEWTNEMKKNSIKLYILSNSNKKDKVSKVANDLELEYTCFARKPLKSGFKKAIQILNLDPKNIGVVGDQILTDVLGANRCKMFSILVKPINERDIWITRIKRPFENILIKKYLKDKKKNKI